MSQIRRYGDELPLARRDVSAGGRFVGQGGCGHDGQGGRVGLAEQGSGTGRPLSAGIRQWMSDSSVPPWSGLRSALGVDSTAFQGSSSA